jgi:hypothetical protein
MVGSLAWPVLMAAIAFVPPRTRNVASRRKVRVAEPREKSMSV